MKQSQESEVPDRGKKKTAILVAGMHRSGTSTLTRVLNAGGCTLPTTFPAADPTNQTGRWGSGKIAHLNDEILASAGSSWRDWTSLDPQWLASPNAGRFRRQAREILEDEFGGSPLFVLNDPRICRLLPFWIETARAHGAEPVIVSPIRNPLDVAASLEESDEIDPFVGRLLWLRYVLDAEKDTRDMKRVWFCYDALLSEPSAVMKVVGDALNISWPMADSTSSTIEIDRSIHRDSCHHRSNDADPPGDPELSCWLKNSLAILVRWAHGDARDKDVEELDWIRSAFDAATPAFSRVLVSSERTIAERDRQIKELSEVIVATNERSVLQSWEICHRDRTIKALKERDELQVREAAHRDLIIEGLYGSMSWRITSPLRRARERARNVLAKGRAGSSRIARTVYHGTPVPYSIKIRIKENLFRSLPFLFKHTAAWREWSAFDPVPHPPGRTEARANRSTPDGDDAGVEQRGSGRSSEMEAARSVSARVAELNSGFVKTSDVCVVFHVWYEDVARRIVSEFLEPILGDIDVFVTTHDAISMKMLDYLEERLPSLYVMLCENRGRDVRPFLQVLPVVLDGGYEIACKIHAKKSSHRIDGDEECILSLESLLSPPGGIQEIVRAFSGNKRLGLVVPPHSPLPLGNPNFHQNNVFWLDHLLTRMGEAGRIGRYEFVFPSGSMFWFRVRALAELANREFVGLDEFEAETGQLDGALQHSIERIVLLLAEKAGFEWMIGSHRPGLSNRGTAAPSDGSSASSGASPAHLERLRPFAMRGQLTRGWYGGRELRPEETTSGVPARSPRIIRYLAKRVYEKGTRHILARYLSGGETEEDRDGLARFALRYGPIDEIRTFLTSREPPDSAAKMADCGGFTIVTPFHRHIDLFEKAAESVSRLFREENTAGSALEWIIVNDDPIVSNEELARRLPERLRPAARQILPDGNGGIVDALNTGVRHGRHRWTLFLDCDDEIESNAITVLKHYIERFPLCRYISSSMVDIDEQGNTLRFRGNEFPIDRLFDIGMMAGHLKAIRGDLFEDVGYLDPYFEPCQDYEFALRTAVQEPVLKIPEPLYRYRWHDRTQSVSRAALQKTVHHRIQRKYLRWFLGRQEGTERDAAAKIRSRSPQTPPLRGAAIVRTQNRRPELLLEAVDSVRIQSHLTPVVVVHGSEDDLRAVEDQLSDRDPADVLFASEDLNPGRCLGYPANVALDYITGRADEFDYLCFLDDDDVFYPCFASRMSDALAWSGADVVYGTSNQRIPWQAAGPGHMPLPSSCLVAGNFITCNSYVLSTGFVRRSGARFDEHLLYFDDWDFLLTLWGAGARFRFIAETVAEYRIYGDGQLPVNKRRYPEVSNANFSQVKDRARKIACATENGLTRFQRGLLDFEWSELRNAEEAGRIAGAAHEIWTEVGQGRDERLTGGVDR